MIAINIKHLVLECNLSFFLSSNISVSELQTTVNHCQCTICILFYPTDERGKSHKTIKIEVTLSVKGAHTIIEFNQISLTKLLFPVWLVAGYINKRITDTKSFYVRYFKLPFHPFVILSWSCFSVSFQKFVKFIEETNVGLSAMEVEKTKCPTEHLDVSFVL